MREGLGRATFADILPLGLLGIVVFSLIFAPQVPASGTQYYHYFFRQGLIM